MVSIKYRKILAKKGLILDPSGLKWPIFDPGHARAAKAYASKALKAGTISKAKYAKIIRASTIANNIFANGGTQADVAAAFKKYKLYLT